MMIVTNYPGANIKVVSISEREALLDVDLRDSSEWFYWNFCVTGVKDKTVRFNFCSELVGRYGPAISYNGIDWAFEPKNCNFDYSKKNFFEFNFDASEQAVYFAFSIPYQVKNFESFCESIKNISGVSKFILTKTEKQRAVPVLVIKSERATRDVVLSCRHHCCESVASYVLEGIVKHIIDNKSDFMNYNFHILPFADLDGVENGDQGKNRLPHDYNRDYIDSPIYETVRSWKKYVLGLNIYAGMDFHCPWKWEYEHDYTAFIFNSYFNPDCGKLSDLLKEQTTGAFSRGGIEHIGQFDMKKGVGWNTVAPTASEFYGMCGAKISFTMEIPYFGKEVMYTVEKARAFGANFAKCLQKHL